MESQPQNPEFMNNLENFHPCETSQNNDKICNVESLAIILSRDYIYKNGSPVAVKRNFRLYIRK